MGRTLEIDSILQNKNFLNNQNYTVSQGTIRKVQSRFFGYRLYKFTKIIMNFAFYIFFFAVTYMLLDSFFPDRRNIYLLFYYFLLFIILSFSILGLIKTKDIILSLKSFIIIYFLFNIHYFEKNIGLVVILLLFTFDIYKLIIYVMYYIFYYIIDKFFLFRNKRLRVFFLNKTDFKNDKKISLFTRFNLARKYVNLSLIKMNEKNNKYPLNLNFLEGIIIFLLFLSPIWGLVLGNGNALVFVLIIIIGYFVLYVFFIIIEMNNQFPFDVENSFLVKKYDNISYIVGDYIIVDTSHSLYWFKI